MTRRTLPLALALGLAAAVAPDARAFVSRADLFVTVSVSSGASPAVMKLSAFDFELLADHVPIPIRSFSPAADPLTGVLLFDGSWTTAMMMAPFVATGPRPADVWSARIEGSRLPDRPRDLFSGAVNEGLITNLAAGDRFRIGTVSRQLRLTPNFASTRSDIRDNAALVLQVPDSDRYGPSPIWDAIGASVDALASENGHKVIIVVTDGMVSGNRLGLREVSERAALAGVAVCVIQESPNFLGPGFRFIDSSSNPWVLLHSKFGNSPEIMLSSLANVTGGVHVIDDSRGDLLPDARPDQRRQNPSTSRARTLIRQVEAVIDRLHRSYSLGFYPPVEDGAVHELTVRVRIPTLRAHARGIFQTFQPKP